MEPIRIQKFFTDCGVLSRRAAEEEIKAGHVRINGEIAQIGQKIDPEHDRVTYQGKPVTMDTHPRNVYVMLNKPRGYVTTMHDEQGRPCVTALIKDIFMKALMEAVICADLKARENVHITAWKCLFNPILHLEMNRCHVLTMSCLQTTTTAKK